MTTTVLLIGALIAAGPDADQGPKADDLAAYRRADDTVGRDPEAHVKLALWCEAHGLGAERLKHLARAVLADPANATARGLLGLVAYQGQWKRPEAVARKVQSDDALTAKLAEYNGRRARARDTADAQWALALWCEQNGLDAEAQAHFTAVTRLDPGREAAWKRLGYRKAGGRWVTDAQLAAERDEAEAQKKADRHWKPLLTKYRSMLGEKNKREAAEAALREVTDPRAVPSVWAVFVAGGGANHDWAVQILGQIDAASSSRALAVLAVFDDSAEVRRAATESLKRRDLRDVVGWLIALIRKPARYEVRPVGGPGSPGALFIEGQRFNVQRLYAPPALPNIPLFPGEPIGFDAYALPVVSRYLGQRQMVDVMFNRTIESAWITAAQYQGMAWARPGVEELIREARANPMSHFPQGRRFAMVSKVPSTVTSTPMESSFTIPIGQILLEYQTSAVVAGQELAADVALVERYNTAVTEANSRIGSVLRGLTEHDEGDDAKAWAAWWTDQQGYAYTPPPEVPVPTVVQNVPLAFQPDPVTLQAQTTQIGPTTGSQSTTVSAHSCFQAGTPVRTLTGSAAIESIRVGDQVLVQDTSTGRLTFQAVTAVFHNRPALIYEIGLDGGETVGATGIHRFWKAGRGWTMARDLKPGDRLRTADATVTVRAVETEEVVPVFNLEVASGQSFFVGGSDLLVHDNSLVLPTTDPFDAAPAAIAAAAETRGR